MFWWLMRANQSEAKIMQGVTHFLRIKYDLTPSIVRILTESVSNVRRFINLSELEGMNYESVSNVRRFINLSELEGMNYESVP